MNAKIKDLLYYCLENSSNKQLVESEFQLFIITVKSLVPFEDKVGCGININRYKEELKILNKYLFCYNESNTSSIKGLSNKYNNTIDYMILPIVIANKDWEIIIDEIFRLITFFTFKTENIIISLVLSKLIKEFLNNNLKEENLIQETKDIIINFSINDYCIKYYNKKLNNKYIINFERERINWLQKLDNFNNNILEKSILFQFIFMKNKFKNTITKNDKIIIDNFASYLLKLRQGIIDPKKLHVNINEIKPLEIYLNKNNFTHPLLGKCIVLERNINNEILIKTKTGIIKVKK